jgi:predicted O-linked N-acetylglucosamine transferase (SPINDLY family)
MSPAKLQSLLQQGIVHHRAGRLAEAELVYARVRALNPNHFDALHLSGLVAYQQGRHVDAIARMERALRLDPRHAVCGMRLGLAYMGAQRLPEAEKRLRHAVALDPSLIAGWENLAVCLKLQDRLSEAVTCHQKVVTLQPGHAAGWYNLGLTLSTLGRVAEALACHERAVAADPQYAQARFGRAQALQQLHRIPEAIADYDRFLRAVPRHAEALSYRLYALHNLDGITRERLFEEHAAFGRLCEPAAEMPEGRSMDPDRRLRVGVLSPDLRRHSCAYFLEPLLAHLDPDGFELYLYHDHFREDEVSARFRQRAAVWRRIVGLSNQAVEKIVREDAPDILIDLAGHVSMTSRLPVFARRVAPVQVTYLGYPNTTGVPAMDFRFTDSVADPEGEADAFATERLVRFASTAWTYEPPREAPDPVPPPAADPGRPVTFGCFNNLAKVTDRMLSVWGRILRAVPESRLVLKGRGLGEAQVRAAFNQRLQKAGLSPDHVELIERTDGLVEHLSLYNGVDITLDTFPYNGTTTTCEALWMGRPVVSRRGDMHMSRVGASLLAAVGHAEWVAENEDDYVRIAVELAQERQGLRDACLGLRTAMRQSVLLDHKGQAERFGEALRQCWQEACARTAELVVTTVGAR